jgi:hypothetical protein
MSSAGSMGLIFTSPGAAARNINENPTWVVPLIIVLAVTLLATAAVHDYQLAAQRAEVESVLRDSGRDQEQIDELFKTSPLRVAMASVLAAVFVGLFIILIPAAILNGISSVSGEKVGFRKMFSLMSHAGLIITLGSLVRTPIMMVKQSADVRTSLAALTPSVSVGSPLGTFLNSLDIFSIWAVVAVCVGYSVLSGMSTKKSTIIVVLLWLAGIALVVGTAALGTLATGRS